MLSQFNFMQILYSLPAVFLALSFHEFSHAFIADRLGDPTPRNQGRLTLDPISHIDPLGFILFLIFGFGWAKPVQVNPNNFRNSRMGDILVSAAGPLSNLLLSFISLGILYMAINVFHFQNAIFLNIIHPIITLNLVFMILNFLPIPPLDGFHVLRDFISPRNIKILWNLERYGFVLLLILSLFGVLGFIIGSIETVVFNAMVSFYDFIFILVM